MIMSLSVVKQIKQWNLIIFALNQPIYPTMPPPPQPGNTQPMKNKEHIKIKAINIWLEIN